MIRLFNIIQNLIFLLLLSTTLKNIKKFNFIYINIEKLKLK